MVDKSTTKFVRIFQVGFILAISVGLRIGEALFGRYFLPDPATS
jgi:hypothetical protein